MDSNTFFGAIKQIQIEKAIPKELVFSAVEQALLAATRKKLGPTKDLRVEINEDTREIHVFLRRLVFEDGFAGEGVEDGVHLKEASKISPGIEIGQILETEFLPEEIGRIAAQTVKQVIVQKIREYERDMVFNEYARRGQFVNGTVHRVENRNIVVDLGKAEAILPPSEQIPRQIFKIGDPIKVCVMDVEMTTKGPVIKVSRGCPDFLVELFRYYIPEIRDGIVQIKAVAREAGIRSKIAVLSVDRKIDPVGACVGLRGSRIKELTAELSNEKIDIIKWDEDMTVFATNALSPAKVVSIQIQDEGHTLSVVVPDFQLSLAIGREGQNVRLAAKLCAAKIDIRSESQYKEMLNQVIDGTFGASEESPAGSEGAAATDEAASAASEGAADAGAEAPASPADSDSGETLAENGRPDAGAVAVAPDAPESDGVDTGEVESPVVRREAASGV